MIDPRLLMSQPKPVDPQKQRIAQMIMSGAPLKAPMPKNAAPMWGEPLNLTPQQQQIFDALKPADQMLFEDEYQKGVDPEELFRMFDPTQQENPGEMFYQEDGQNRFNDAAAYQTADASGEIELPYGNEKLTEGQSKDVGFFRRALAANQALTPEKEQALLQFTDSFAGKFGGVGRLFQDADYQTAIRDAKEFLAVVLRKDTGATVTDQEFELYGPLYIPMPGDKPELLEAKRRAREQFLTGLEMGMGTAAPLAARSRQDLKPQEMSDEDILRMLQGGN